MCVFLNGYPDRAISISRPNSVKFLFVGMKIEVCERKVDTRDQSLAFRMLLPAYRNVKIKSDEQHAIFVLELQSALRLAVGFSNIVVTCNRFF